MTSNQLAHGVTEVTDVQPVLRVTDLTTQFDTQDGMVHAVNGASVELADGAVRGVGVNEGGDGGVAQAGLQEALNLFLDEA